MSVIIRLQNLPWSANALDIRQFFKGLSIPDGGVHIVGGEMGDAFIAFSTDEDARQAMMQDRRKINEVQVRLLLSSRAEMQKIIETARQQSLLALKNAGALGALKPALATKSLATPQPPVITPNSLHNILSTSAAPSFLAYQKQAGITLIEPPTENTTSNSTTTGNATVESTTSRRSSVEKSRERRRSSSRDRRRSRSRDRNDRHDRNSSRRGRRDRSRSRSRERDWKGRRSNRRSRSRDRSHDRNRDRTPDRTRSSSNRNTTSNKERESEKSQSNKPNTDLSAFINKIAPSRFTEVTESNNSIKVASLPSWGIPPMNAYQTNNASSNSASSILNPFSLGGSSIPGLRTTPLTNSYTTTTSNKSADAESSLTGVNIAATTSVVPSFQNYTTTLSSVNNYSINLFSTNSNSSESAKHFALQNPYTAAIQQSALNTTKTQESTNSATASPQKQAAVVIQPTMFPGISLMDKLTNETQANTLTTTTTTTTGFATVNQLPEEPIAFANTNPYAQIYPNLFAQAAAGNLTKPNTIQQQKQQREHDQQQQQHQNQQLQQSKESWKESCCLKISNMCSSTTYSDVRKFFMGLFIPHNGIKMVNDKHGTRIGVAYIQFSRVSSLHKAMSRNNSFLKTKMIKMEVVSEEEFEKAEDSYRPHGRFDRTNERSSNYQDNRNDNDHRGNDYDGGDSDGDSNYQSNRENNADFDMKSEAFTVLYIEDLPSQTGEHDLMRMFSSYTIFDILLMPSRENRREFRAFVLFSRAEEAKIALEDISKHMIGHRKVRVRSCTVNEMEREKEKLRLANEQLIKEEEALAEAERLREAENLGEDDMDLADDAKSLNGDEINNENNESQQQEENLLSTDQDQVIPMDQSTNKIPSLFEIPPINADDMLIKNGNEGRSGIPSDPRLRRQKRSRFEPLKSENETNQNMNFNDTPNVSSNEGNINMGSSNGGNMGMEFNMGGSMGNMNSMGSMMGMGGNTDMNDDMNGMNNMNNNNNIGMNMNMGSGGNFPHDCNPNNNNMSNNNMNMSNMNMNDINFNNNNNNMSGIENNFIIMKNCDYNTRINDVAEFLQSAFLRLKHIEPLRGDRNMPTGEFIVEFQDERDAQTAIRQFNNTTFRQRKVRMRPIMPQEIANRIGKPFMNCYPGDGGRGGGGGSRSYERIPYPFNDGPSSSRFGGRYDNENSNSYNNGGRSGGGSMRNRSGSRFDHSNNSMRRQGRSRFNNSISSQDGHSEDDVQVIDDSSNDISEIGQRSANGGGGGGGGGVGDGGDGDGGDGDVGSNTGGDDGVDGSGSGDIAGDDGGMDDSNGIPEKFTRPGCVVAMENVPFKADLQDILRFFSGYDLTPDDIIRRFNDDGTPTGDARVTFGRPSIARSAYNSRRRRTIFNRTIHLTLL